MNEKVIWDCLLQKVGNERGVAAIMGNLMAESSLKPACATGKNKTANYVTDADNGNVDFANDGVAFGLVQWCYKTRKAGLLAYAKSTGRSVGHLQMQLEYLVKEMRESYKSVWKAVTEATNIRTASDIVMLQYEKPSGTSEAAKAKRGAYAQKFYAEFAGEQIVPVPQPASEKRIRAKSQVNVRLAPTTVIPKIGELKKGDELELISSDDHWCKVAVYVMKKFVEEIG